MPPVTGCNPGPRPTFIPVPHTAKAVMRYSLFGQTVENVFHFLGPDDFNVATCQLLAETMQLEWNNIVKSTLSPQLELLDITVTGIHTRFGPQFIAPVGVTGTNIGAAFADPGATLAIKFGTAQIGRSYRGRMYWPCLQAPEVTAGVVNSAYASGLAVAMQAFFGQVGASAGVEHVIVSYQNDCIWRTVGLPVLVTSYTVTDYNVDSQRRRLIGRGI